MVFESILFLLVVYQFVQTKRMAEISSPHILIVFVRDGAWAFALIFGTHLSGVKYSGYKSDTTTSYVAVLLWSTMSFELTPVKGDVGLT